MGGGFHNPFIGKLFKNITIAPEFNKDLKKLSKRFSSLSDDLKIFIKVALNAYHKQNIDSRAIFCISDLGIHSPKIYKAKKFACKSLKGKGAQSGIRVIYSYDESEDRIEFIEMYYKGDKENEDRGRIVDFQTNSPGSFRFIPHLYPVLNYRTRPAEMSTGLNRL